MLDIGIVHEENVRPVYETKQDRERALDDMRELRDKAGVDFAEQPAFCPYDFKLFFNDKLFGYAEHKHRPTLSINKYPRYFISKKKWDSLMRLYDDSKGRNIFLVIRFKEGIYIYSHSKAKERPVFQKGGRTDRGDPQDVEECAYLSCADFKRVV